MGNLADNKKNYEINKWWIFIELWNSIFFNFSKFWFVFWILGIDKKQIIQLIKNNWNWKKIYDQTDYI